MIPRAAFLMMGGCGEARAFDEAGYQVVGGINHAEICVDTARANWNTATWFQHDATQFPMELLPEADVLVGGVICNELSRNAGRRSTQRDPNQDAIPTAADAVEDDRFKLTRATAWCVVRAVEVHLPKAIVVENVTDFVTRWKPYEPWRAAIHAFDYRSEVVSLNAAHVTGDNNPIADAWRDRTFTVFTRLDVPAPNLDYRPLAWCPSCSRDIRARQSWSIGKHAGEYRKQYLYRCGTDLCGRVVEPYTGAASNAFDLNDVGEPVGGPRIKGRTVLAAATIRRAEEALEFLQDPRRYRRRIPGGDHLTHIDGRYHAVVELRRNCAGASIHEPLSTVTAQGRHHFLLSAPEGWKPGMRLNVNDALFRSIYPPEQIRALRFPKHHIMAAKRDEDLSLLAGNAVPVNVGHFLGARLREVLT